MLIAPLNTGSLGQHALRVTVPTYDRTALTPSVVHISVGSFHRSHQALYFDELAERRITTAWGLVGVGLHRPEMREALTPQDGLYTVVTRGGASDQARVVGVIRRYLFAPEESGGVVATLADARTRLVTLTITAHGYAGEDPEALVLLVEALARRRRDGLPPFTVLSCDNLPDNGALAREAVLACARKRDEGLADWIATEGAFPSSVVDRITPKTTPADRERLAQQFGVDDRWPVMTEPFSQWVIEDEFADGRPPLDQVGVRFVRDARPYALIKTRLLNGSHCALGPLGFLAGHRTASEALADPLFRAYLERLMADEVQPLLPLVDGINPATYRNTLLARLANPALADDLGRLCRNLSAKLPLHVLSSIAEARDGGRPHPLLTFAVAGWLRYLRGADERGEGFAIEDPRAERLRALARRGGADPRPVLAERDVFGALADDAAFALAVERDLRSLDTHGARAALADRLSVHDRKVAA
ncbi:mannitol dehydrogenase family protein [Solirubrobacter deserti]|uniref:Mannitol dehydrogenase family protein n=1 Tax=Solirubrobacter deserti TaxID=2282478 RepID=A0ABT4RFI2_9ACTN|nr:mannitol dehydrogenase family protein [Solirubrobacter deserti]MDA0137279.1 mannitol dehydrogenase family protein [Solirubrobacter deserti]